MIRNKLRKIIGIVAVLLLILGGVMVVKHRRAKLAEVPPPRKTVLSVHTAETRKGTFEAKRRFLGTIAAKVSADVTPRVTGNLIEVRVREGEKVRRGDLLALVDDRSQQDRVAEIRAQLAAAETALSTQEAVYARDAKLFKAKAVSREALDHSLTVRDSARAQVTTLRKALHSAETDLSYTRLRAPFSGIITARLADPGDLAQPGRPVLAMEAPQDGYYVSVKIPQALFPVLKPGGKALISAGTGSKTPLRATVSRIHPVVRQGTLATVEIDTDGRPFDLPTGATIDVDLVTGIHEGWRVPARAVLENTDASYVYLITEKGAIHVEKVAVLAKSADAAVIQGGLTEASRVVVAQESALLRLHEGQKVHAVKAGDRQGHIAP